LIFLASASILIGFTAYLHHTNGNDYEFRRTCSAAAELIKKIKKG
jgi:hypothetical protein